MYFFGLTGAFGIFLYLRFLAAVNKILTGGRGDRVGDFDARCPSFVVDLERFTLISFKFTLCVSTVNFGGAFQVKMIRFL